MSNIIKSFNEVPGVDDSSDGIKRRLLLTRFVKKAVDNPNPKLPHEIKLDNTIRNKFGSKEYGAIFLAYLIETFNKFGFTFPTPKEVELSTDDYNRENDLVGAFITQLYEATESYEDKVFLSDVWIVWNSYSRFREVGLKQSRDLSQKLKAKGLQVTIVTGLTILSYFKLKSQDVSPNLTDAADDVDVE